MAPQAQCERALELFASELSRRKNVVGLGIFSENTGESGARRRGCAVAVYVKKKVPAARLPKTDLVPDCLTITGRHGPVRIRTRVIEQGEVRLETV
jgi:hypothetical protein